MAMQIEPILVALRMHRLATLLIALEIALACAVLCNASFLIANRFASMDVHSGIDERSLALLSIEGFEDTQAADINARLLTGLRALPGMASVSVVSSVPFGPQPATAGTELDVARTLRGPQVDLYVAGPGALEAMGLRLVAGQAPSPADFLPVVDFLPSNPRVLVTRAVAAHVWPSESPLGKVLWVGGNRLTVMGVVDHLAIAAPGSRGTESAEWSVFVPGMPGAKLAGRYLLRGKPGDMGRLLRQAQDAVPKLAPEVVLNRHDSGTVSDLRQRFFKQDRVMAGMLGGVILSLLLVTALGIVGLASFWVAQRRRQIGIRRAIGATRRDILRYFQIENFIIVTLGIVLGMGLAFGLNAVLMKVYELPHLPLSYLPVGAIVLWLLGQLAVLGPALRAAAVPPVVATRSI